MNLRDLISCLDLRSDGQKAAFSVHYLLAADAAEAMARFSPILAVIGYGAALPTGLDVPFVACPLLSADNMPRFEVWTTASACRPFSLGPVVGACSDDMAFGAIKLEEGTAVLLEDCVELAYLRIFDFLDSSEFGTPIRFWNYLTGIVENDGGLERYRRFNIGRNKAFAARLRQVQPPAASGVGGLGGASVIYFLAAREVATPIENPRQVSAYQYPEIYGPRSPSFSRASVYAQGMDEALFISGTASIVGHETVHAGDLAGQIAETCANLHALIGACGEVAKKPVVLQAGGWALKIYLENPSFHGRVDCAIDAMFGPETQRLYLHGEICRPGLLLEIEGFYRN